MAEIEHQRQPRPIPAQPTAMTFAAALLVVFALLAPAASAMEFETPKRLEADSGGDRAEDRHGSLAADGEDRWIAVWESDRGASQGDDSDILYARSTDGGASWSSPEALHGVPGPGGGASGAKNVYPQVAAGRDGAWIVVWESTDTLGDSIGSDADILMSRSNDGGRTWGRPTALNAYAAMDRAGDHSPRIATDGRGVWMALWLSRHDLDGRIGTDLDLLFAVSTDNGATWSDPGVANSSATTDANKAADLNPHLSTDGAGAWMTLWESFGSIGIDVDLAVTRSTDGGAHWTPAALLNSNGRTDSNSDFGPQAATDSDGNWLAVWWSDDSLGGRLGADFDILLTRSADQGESWSAPAPIDAAAVSDRGRDSHPQIATDGAGRWVIVWESTNPLGGRLGDDPDILYAVSTDGGLNWSSPEPCDASAETDSAVDRRPRIATDGNGRWIVLWESGGAGEGNADPENSDEDFDIVITRGSFDPSDSKVAAGDEP